MEAWFSQIRSHIGSYVYVVLFSFLQIKCLISFGLFIRSYVAIDEVEGHGPPYIKFITLILLKLIQLSC